MSLSPSSHSPCAACKFLRRKCTQECVFWPYFPPEQPQKFAAVHRVFGASNVAKLLNSIPVPLREEAAASLAFEADSRLRDPVYGCLSTMSVLDAHLRHLKAQSLSAKHELADYLGPQALVTTLQPCQLAHNNSYAYQQQQMFGVEDYGGYDNQALQVQVQAQAQAQAHHYGMIGNGVAYDHRAHCNSDVAPPC